MVVQGIAAVVLGISLLAAPPDLSVGDPAPDLSIANWVKGEAVDLGKLQGNKVAVVEFWATWCGPCRISIPHLTELQKEYAEKDVVVIGISSGEKLWKVEEFVEEWGEKMGYTVAQDDERKTFNAWMKAAGENGIPTAFVVNKDGKIAWIGHPMSGLGKAIDAVLAGTHSMDKEIQRRKEEKEREQEMVAARRRQMEIQQKFKECVDAGKLDHAREIAGDITEQIGDNAQGLNNFAWSLMTEEPFKGKFNELALKLATRSCDLANGKSWYICDTLALAKFLNGDVAEAVRLEEGAIRMAKRDGVPEKQIAELEAALERFKAKTEKKRKVY